MDGASPTCLGSGVRSEVPTPTRRRRLVVEVAPNVIDVSAVALPGSPLLVTNAESDGEGVPASHLWDSDEEDELDTFTSSGRSANSGLCRGGITLDREPTNASKFRRDSGWLSTAMGARSHSDRQ